MSRASRLFIAVTVLTFATIGVGAFAGNVAALNTNEQVTVTPNTTNDVANYTLNAEFGSSVNDVEYLNISLANNGAPEALGTDISGAGVANITFQDSNNGTIALGSVIRRHDNNNDGLNDGINVTLASPTDFASGTVATITVEDVVNSNRTTTAGFTPADYESDWDLRQSDGSLGISTTASDAAYTIQPSLIVSVDAPRTVPYNDSFDVTATVVNQGTSTASGDITYAADADLGDITPGNPTDLPSIDTGSVGPLAPGANGSATFTVNSANTTDGGDFGALTDEEINQIAHGAYVNDSNTTRGYFESLVNASLTVGTSNREGAITVEVDDTDQLPVANANVSLYVDSVAPGNLLAENVTATAGPDSNQIRFSDQSPTTPESRVDLAVGPNASDAIQYVAVANKPGFQSDNGGTSLHENREFDTIELELEPIVNAAEINVIQTADSGVARNRTDIGFAIKVFGDRFGDIYPDADVTVDIDATVNNASVTLVNEDTGGVYNGNDNPTFATGNGMLNLTTRSGVEQDVDYTFTVGSNSSAIITGNGPVGLASTHPRTKSFVLSGEGEVQGEVYSQATTNQIQNASVWAVDMASWEANDRELGINITRLEETVPADGNDVGVDNTTVYVRLVDNDTGAPLEHDEYDVRTRPTDTSNRQVAELNTTDPRQGPGYALLDNDDDDWVYFHSYRYAPQEYTVDVSLTGGNISDGRVADGVTENFTRVINTTGTSFKVIENGDDATAYSDPAEIQVPTDTTSVLPAVAVPTANLTLERAVAKSRASDLPNIVGANFADTPGFVNSFGFETGGTNENGQWVLNRLPTDFQSGLEGYGYGYGNDQNINSDPLDYVLIATKPGYDDDHRFVNIREDGVDWYSSRDDFYDASQSSSDFQLTPVDVGPGYLNITDVGFNDQCQTSDMTPFADTSDDFPQELSRDGTLDVIEVETRSDDGGVLLNATVDLSVLDAGGNVTSATNFTGSIECVEGGAIVSDGDEVDDQTFYTGSDGLATVYLQTDSSSEDLLALEENDSSGPNEPPTNVTGVFGQLIEDATATDFTAKKFRGVIEFKTASLSGIVTDSNDDPIPGSAVWAYRFNRDPSAIQPEFEIVPQVIDNGSATWSTSSNSSVLADGVDDLSDKFVVRRLNASGGVIASDVARAGQLKNYTFTAFAGVSVENEFKLYDRAEDSNDASFTLDPVPAYVGSPQPTTDYLVRGVKYDAPFNGRLGNDGLGNVVPNTTDDANVVIPIDIENQTAPGNGGGGGDALDPYDGDNSGAIDTTGELQDVINAFLGGSLDTADLQQAIGEFLAA